MSSMTISDFMEYDSVEACTINELLRYSATELKDKFNCTDEGEFFRFGDREDNAYYVMVFKEPEAFGTLVIAYCRGFEKPEASNHYILLQNVGYNLICAFKKTVNWEPELKD